MNETSVQVRPLAWKTIARVSIALVPILWLVHVLLLGWMRFSETKLGALTDRHLVPVNGEWDPRLTLWSAPAFLVLLIFLVAVVPRLLKARLRTVMLVSVVSYMAITTSVSMIDGLVDYWDGKHAAIVMPMARTHLEYYGDVPLVEKVGGPREFIWKYAKPRLFEQLSLHSRTHPPGGAVFLWAVSRLIGKGPWAAALSMIAFSSLACVLVFLIGKELYGEMAARAALLLFLVTPNAVMYGATSMDAVFAVPAMLSLYFFLRSQRPGESRARCLMWGGLSGLWLAAASFMTYAVVFLPLFFLVMALDPRKERSPLSRMIRAHAAGLVAFSCFYAALFAWAQYNPLASVAASIAKDALMMGTGYESWATYWVISLSNLVAFAAGMGFPTLGLWLLSNNRANGWRHDEFARSFVVSWFIIGFSTLFTLEVERVWLFMSPFVLAPAGRWLSEDSLSVNGNITLNRFVTALAVNTLLAESLIDIGW